MPPLRRRIQGRNREPTESHGGPPNRNGITESEMHFLKAMSGGHLGGDEVAIERK